MKFGKRMRGLASKEWESGYVDYKHLKQQIRLLQEQRQQQHDSAETTPAAAAATATQTFTALLAHEMHKINAAHAAIQEQIEHGDLVTLRAALGNRWVLSPAKARSLLLDAIELSHKVDAFRRFVVLNSLALVKISKKFDKAMGTSSVRADVLDALKHQSFYDDACLDRICAAASALTDRIMLCVLPDGNFRIDQSAVACPICLSADVKTPITLACAHAFCWSCLSKAAEHRFNSCPLCRQAQSLDPRYYEIDGLVKRFKRAYSFVERGLDRAPFASCRMRQILAEAFELVNAYLRQVDAQYASVSPPASVCGDVSEATAVIVPLPPATTTVSVATSGDSSSVKKATAPTDEVAAVAVSVVRSADESDAQAEPEPKPLAAALATMVLDSAFERGDPVEIFSHGHWYPGMVMQCNADATYSVLWWVHDNSQRFGQKVARSQLREPFLSDTDDDASSLYDAAADAWRTATEWALEPFRRLRSLSSTSERVAS